MNTEPELTRRIPSILNQDPQKTSVFLENAPLGIIIIDEEGRIQYGNPQLEAMFGYSIHSLLGKPVETLIPAKLRKIHSKHRENFLQNPINRSMGTGLDLTGRKMTGELFPVEVGLSHLRKNGSLFIIAFIADITVRKKTEVLLSHQNRFLSTFQQTSLQILSNLNLFEVLESLLKNATSLLGFNHGQVLLFNDEMGEFECIVGIGCFENMISLCMDHNIRLYIRLTQMEQPFILHAQTDTMPDFLQNCDEEVNCLMTVPLKSVDKSIGLILLAGHTDTKDQPSIRVEDILKHIGQLASIAVQNAQLFNQVQQAKKMSEEQKKRMENELEIARKVQIALLPREYPEVDGWSFAALWKPAREVAGDFYDFIKRHDGCIDIIIADVTDKGAPAALYMAHNKGMLRKSLQNTQTLVDGVKAANQSMVEEDVGPFVTSFLARVNPENGELSYVNAGHDPPLLVKVGSEKLVELTATGLPLGIDLNFEHQFRNIAIENGDLLVLYTDGVLDAMNEKHDLFGKERFIEAVIANREKEAEEIAGALLMEVESFIAQTTPVDDIAIIVVQRH